MVFRPLDNLKNYPSQKCSPKLVKIPLAVYVETDIEISCHLFLNSQVLSNEFWDTVLWTTFLNEKIKCPITIMCIELSLTIKHWFDINMPTHWHIRKSLLNKSTDSANSMALETIHTPRLQPHDRYTSTATHWPNRDFARRFIMLSAKGWKREIKRSSSRSFVPTVSKTRTKQLTQDTFSHITNHIPRLLSMVVCHAF